MHNKVVYRIARGLRKSGAVVLRFNYRGVNLSEGEYGHGVGEMEDARVLSPGCGSGIPTCRTRLPAFLSARESCFRSRAAIAVRRRVIAVGFPTTYKNRDYLQRLSCSEDLHSKYP